MQPAAKSVILDLLSTLRGRPMPVRALIAAGGVFEIAADNMRVALARLLARRLIERNERGQYRIAPPAAALERHVGSWTKVEERIAAWGGGWIGVYTALSARPSRAAARRSQRALELCGLRAFGRDLWVRPDNLSAGVDGVRTQLRDLGMPESSTVFLLGGLDAVSATRARQLWDIAALRRGYREMRTSLGRSAARLPRLSAREAMAESFVLGGDAIRRIVRDPLLPEEMLPAAERRSFVETLREYDQIGRACWRPFMEAHGAPHFTAPRALGEVRDHRPAVAAG